MSASATLKDPRRYFEEVGSQRSTVPADPPVCLYLEVTNRCNLLCETCPRTFETLEPPADMSWELFTSIVDQVPNIARVVLHGVGEPMLVKDLPRMVRYLKDREHLRSVQYQRHADAAEEVSGDSSTRDWTSFAFRSMQPIGNPIARIRGKDFFNRIVRDVGKFIAYQREVGATTPRVSLWLTGLKETVDQLPAFVRLAATMGVHGGPPAASGVRRRGLRHGPRRQLAVRKHTGRRSERRSRRRRPSAPNWASRWMPPARRSPG